MHLSTGNITLAVTLMIFCIIGRLRLVSVTIDREFVTSAKKFANFNEFSEIKKKVKIRTKIR